MPEPLLTALKFVFLALVYLFFFRVLRAVWVHDLNPRQTVTTAAAAGNRAPARAPAAAKPRDVGPRQLVVTGPAALAGQQFTVDDEATVGRTAGCAVHLDDSTVSQLHARLFLRDGRLFVEDLGSTNGTFINRKPVKAPEELRRGDRVTFGQTHLEVRR